MRLPLRSRVTFELLSCAASAAPDPNIELEHEERQPARWPLSAALRYRALRLRNDRVLRLCDVCLRNRRRCHDSRRPRTDKSWKTYRLQQWAVEP